MSGSLSDLVDRFTVHGGRVALARAAFPKVAEWVDLSTGIAPWAYPVRLGPTQMTALPDPAELAELTAKAAACYGTTADHMLAVPGTDLAMRLLGTILPSRSGWVTPGYSGHRTMWPGGATVAVERSELGGPLDRIANVVLARPNNPDGWIADRQLLETVAAALSSRGGHLIVDEAFADAMGPDSVSGCDWPGLIVLRSFGKFYGLPGLRLGFVIAAPDVLARLRALLGDWPISGPALAAGRAALADTDWQETQRARLTAGAARVAALLADVGVSTVGQTPFFTLVASKHRDALFAHLAAHGILTRPFAAQPRWLRFGLLGEEAGWARLSQALTSWRAA